MNLVSYNKDWMDKLQPTGHSGMNVMRVTNHFRLDLGPVL